MTGRSATTQFSLQVLEIYHENIYLLAGKGHQEVSAVQPCNRRLLL